MLLEFGASAKVVEPIVAEQNAGQPRQGSRFVRGQSVCVSKDFDRFLVRVGGRQ